MSPPISFPLREQARRHLENAAQLLKGESQQLIYACLELRLSIEALIYETLQTYAKTLSPAVATAYQHWQPGKVLGLLREHDPLADRSLRVQARRVADDGGPEQGPPFFEGTDSRLTVEWVEKAHRSMSSFLHQRTISQLEKGKPIDEAVLRTEAARISARLAEVLKSEVYNIRITGGFEFSCPRCTAALTVDMSPLILNGFADTSCISCSTAWKVELDKAGEPRIVPADLA
ncbi:hypothetical protein H4W29_005611 [Rhizobium viscosum]|uniref:Uncharacterized protein n=1 Tax=Rhizobium viscosum TaxID=1673 RepID=A0ABR9IYR5_RHIVS|nr:hypothetical protein [Rhizobium viscosum]